jgi:hypothetical protein
MEPEPTIADAQNALRQLVRWLRPLIAAYEKIEALRDLGNAVGETSARVNALRQEEGALRARVDAARSGAERLTAGARAGAEAAGEEAKRTVSDAKSKAKEITDQARMIAAAITEDAKQFKKGIEDEAKQIAAGFKRLKVG